MAWFLMLTMTVHGLCAFTLGAQLAAELDDYLVGEGTLADTPPLLLGLALHGSCAVWALLLLLSME